MLGLKKVFVHAFKENEFQNIPKPFAYSSPKVFFANLFKVKKSHILTLHELFQV